MAKNHEEMAKELGLNPERFKTTDKKVIDSLEQAYAFKNKKRGK